MSIFVLIGVKRLKYQNTQILDLRYQKMRMMQNDYKKFHPDDIKEITWWGKFVNTSLLGKEWFTKHVNVCFALETERLPSVSLVTMFKVSENDITNYQPCDSFMVMSSEDITNYQQSDNYNKVILEKFTEYSALWITDNDGNRSQMSFWRYYQLSAKW